MQTELTIHLPPAPIAYPIATLLDRVLGTHPIHTYNKCQLKSFLQFHCPTSRPHYHNHPAAATTGNADDASTCSGERSPRREYSPSPTAVSASERSHHTRRYDAAQPQPPPSPSSEHGSRDVDADAEGALREEEVCILSGVLELGGKSVEGIMTTMDVCVDVILFFLALMADWVLVFFLCVRCFSMLSR
jgi:hypothetical protein